MEKSKKAESTMLSRNISCEASVMNILTPETIDLANTIVKSIAEDDEIALLVQITNQNNLHMALALPDSPVPQGIDANASLIAFRDWLINGARNIRADISQVPSNSKNSLAFHRLSAPEAMDIATGQWQDIEWLYHLRANRHGPAETRIGEFVLLFLMTGTGRQRATFSMPKGIFG